MNDEKQLAESAPVQAEFDLLAENYRSQHAANIAITGEDPEYFSEYKLADLCAWLKQLELPVANTLDFGCGIGNSLPFFRQYFPDSQVTCADVSARSIEIAQSRFPGSENYVLLDKAIPLADDSQDIVFSAGVFHHIPHKEHGYWLAELLRVTKPGGVLAIYDHNPLNPLTVYAVNTCPLDANAKLIRGGILKQQVLASGWQNAQIDYKLFFPAFLSAFRPFEAYLEWLCLGAQYRLLARKFE